MFFQTYRKDRKDLPEIKPSVVVNVDPFIKHEPVGKSDIVPYVSIPESAADPEAVSQGLREFGIREHGFDEIWASYSVPYYLETPEEVAGMFEVITQNLAEGGIARIFPLSVSDNSETGESYDELVHQIEILNNSQNYNVYVVQNPVGSALFIRNLKQKTT